MSACIMKFAVSFFLNDGHFASAVYYFISGPSLLVEIILLDCS